MTRIRELGPTIVGSSCNILQFCKILNPKHCAHLRSSHLGGIQRQAGAQRGAQDAQHAFGKPLNPMHTLTPACAPL